MSLDPTVRAAWDAFNGPLEGPDINTLYDDIKGLPTVATGILVDSITSMQSMAWLRSDGSRATPEEESAEWSRVRAMRPALVWSAYRSPTGLHLAPDEIQRIVTARLDADVEELARVFSDFATWPWQAQAATCSMAWALGAGFSSSWPHWTMAALAQHWDECAANCEIQWSNNPGVRPRDLAQRSLFLLASGMTPDDARASWPSGPASDAAARALAGFVLSSNEVGSS